MRVVIDTSVVIARARSPHGASRVLMDWIEDDKIQGVASMALILEYEDVLARQREHTGWSYVDVRNFLDRICDKCEHVVPSFSFRPAVHDPDDEFVVELAFAANVDYLVTLNPRDFVGCESLGIKVISPGELVRREREKP